MDSDTQKDTNFSDSDMDQVSLLMHDPHRQFGNRGSYSVYNEKKRRRSGKETSPKFVCSKSDLSDLFDEKLTKFLDPLKNEISQLKDSVSFKKVAELESRVSTVEKENTTLRHRVTYLESQVRRNNIRFYGIRESGKAEHENCEQKVQNTLSGIVPNIDDRSFEFVTRLGKYNAENTRPILCKLNHFKDKLAILNKRDELKGLGVKISDDHTKEVDGNRKILLPIFHEAHKQNLNPKLISDKLRIGSKTYTVDNLHSLPQNLKLESIYTPSNNGITAFFTKNSPLSNHYQCKLTVNNESFNCMEQYIMVSKARLFADLESESALLQEKCPKAQKEIGKNIKNFKSDVWRTNVEDLLLKGLTAKFSGSSYLRRFLLNTGNDVLVEATTNTFWGIGFHLQDPNLWDSSKHTGKNLMGQQLMKLRSQLK